MTAPEVDLETRLKLRAKPHGKPAMFQTWRNLLFVHWKFDPAVLESLLPSGLHVDTFEGDAWIGIVPFYMRNIRPRFLPAVPGISNFLELNVRTYVVDSNGIPAVWFFSLDADSRLACFLGRKFFNLNYCDADMSAVEDETGIRYTTRRHGEADTANFHYQRIGESRLAEPGSLDFFLVERYLLFSQSTSDRIYRGRVHHPPYEIRDAEVREFSTLPATWDGITLPERPADHIAYSDGVDVKIYGLES